ncbi:MAG: hypothetical protein H5T50_02905 [Nitrososphaeria archaeon]|nr:hypothetical protein [Nitrososphaeria archaeon]
MVKNVFIEKSTLFAGESLKIKNYSGVILKTKLYVITISDLLKKKEGKGFPEYEVIFSSIIEKELYDGETEIKYPETFPPTVSTKHFKTRCSLVIGRPRFGGKILYPRTEIRLKILPVYNIEVEVNKDEDKLLLRKTYYEPDEEIFCKVSGEIKNATAGVLIREWIVEGNEERFDEYVLEESRIENNELTIRLPHDFTKIEDPFLFYPYSFCSITPKVKFGIKTYIFVQNESTLSKKEIALVPKKPHFRKIVSEK